MDFERLSGDLKELRRRSRALGTAVGLLAAGQTAAGVLSPKAAALTEGVLRAMLFTKLKPAAAVFLAGLDCPLTTWENSLRKLAGKK